MDRLILLFLILGTHAANAVEVVAGAAQAFHAAYTLGGCDQVNEGAASEALERAKACVPSGANTKASALTDVSQNVLIPAEDKYFATLGSQHAKELACAAEYGATLTRDPKLVSQVGAKFQVMRDARQTWLKSIAAVRGDRTLAGRTCPTSVDELDEKHDNVKFTTQCRTVIVAKATYDAVNASLPLGGSAIVKKASEDYANGPNDQSEDALNKLASATLNSASRDLQSHSEKLRARTQSGKDPGFTPDEKAELLSDPTVVDHVTGAEPKLLKPVACRADARYGRGRSNLITTLNVSTMLFAGGAVAVTKGAAVLAKAGASAGRLSSGAALILRAGAVGATAATVAADVGHICGSGEFQQKARAGACVSAPTIERMNADNCALAATLTAINATSLVPSTKLAMFFLPGFFAKKSKEAKATAAASESVGAVATVDKFESAGRYRPGGGAVETYLEENFAQSAIRMSEYRKLSPEGKAQFSLKMYSKMPDAETLPAVTPGLEKYVDQVKQKYGHQPLLKEEPAGSYFQSMEKTPMLAAVDPMTGERLGGIAYTRKGDQLYIDLMRMNDKGSGMGGYLFNQALARHPGVKRIGAELGYDNAKAIEAELNRVRGAKIATPQMCEQAIKASSLYKLAARAGYTSIVEINCRAPYHLEFTRP